MVPAIAVIGVRHGVTTPRPSPWAQKRQTLDKCDRYGKVGNLIPQRSTIVVLNLPQTHERSKAMIGQVHNQKSSAPMTLLFFLLSHKVKHACVLIYLAMRQMYSNDICCMRATIVCGRM